MKAAIRLEMSKKDDNLLMEKVAAYVATIGTVNAEVNKGLLVTYHRSQIHKAFKLGRASNTTVEDTEEG